MGFFKAFTKAFREHYRVEPPAIDPPAEAPVVEDPVFLVYEAIISWDSPGFTVHIAENTIGNIVLADPNEDGTVATLTLVGAFPEYRTFVYAGSAQFNINGDPASIDSFRSSDDYISLSSHEPGIPINGVPILIKVKQL